MTVGVILGSVDHAAMAAASNSVYSRLILDDARLAPVLTALHGGIKDGVMAPQLHGLEHYWPPSLMAAAGTDGKVAAWLVGDGWRALKTCLLACKAVGRTPPHYRRG